MFTDDEEPVTGPAGMTLLEAEVWTVFALLPAEVSCELAVDVLHGTVKVTVVGVGAQTVQTVTLVVQPSWIDVVVGAAGLIVVLQVVVTAIKPVGQILV